MGDGLFGRGVDNTGILKKRAGTMSAIQSAFKPNALSNDSDQSVSHLLSSIQKYISSLKEKGVLESLTGNCKLPGSSLYKDTVKRIRFYVTCICTQTTDIEEAATSVLNLELAYEKENNIEINKVIQDLDRLFLNSEYEARIETEVDKTLQTQIILNLLTQLNLNLNEYCSLLEYFEVENFPEELQNRVLMDTTVFKAFNQFNSSVKQEKDKYQRFEDFVVFYDKRKQFERLAQVSTASIKSPTFMTTNIIGNMDMVGFAEFMLTFELSIALDFVPVIGTAKMILEAAGGVDLLTGQKLELWQRILIAAPISIKGTSKIMSVAARAIGKSVNQSMVATVMVTRLVLQLPAPAVRMVDRVEMISGYIVKASRVESKAIEVAGLEIKGVSESAKITSVQKLAARDVINWGKAIEVISPLIRVSKNYNTYIDTPDDLSRTVGTPYDSVTSRRTGSRTRPRTKRRVPSRKTRKPKVVRLKAANDRFMLTKMHTDLRTGQKVLLSYINPYCTPNQYRYRLTKRLQYLTITERQFTTKFLIKANGRLYTASGRKMTATYLFNHPEIVDAGHVISSYSGAKDKIVLMTAWNNRIKLGMIEKGQAGWISGGFRVRIIDGIAIQEESVEAMRLAGFLSEDTISNAPLVSVDAL